MWQDMTAERFQRRFGSGTAETVIRAAVRRYGERTVLTTSFGIQSAVLLHAATRIYPAIPVIWIDTGYLPTETYRYAEELKRRFSLNLHVYQSQVSPARMEALAGRLWEQDDPESLTRYDQLRKVEPLQRALSDLGARAWLSGVRRDQTSYRRTLPRAVDHSGIVKIHPLLSWTDADVDAYVLSHELPRHPLEERGYVTVGDAHSSRPVTESDPGGRATRFRGRKEECGIHLPSTGKPPLAFSVKLFNT